MPYSNVPEADWDAMDSCVDKVQAQGHSKESAIAICHTSIVGGKSLNTAILDYVKAHKNYMTPTDEPCTDIRNAAQAIAQVTYLAEAENLEPSDRARIVKILRDLLDFTSSELDEYEAGDEAGNEDGAENDGEMEPAMMSVRPNLSYIKSLGISKPANYFKDVLAVKSTGANTVKGYLTLWGSPNHLDIEGEYFTKSTDFWDDVLAFPRPLTWNHGQDRNVFKSTDVVGQVESFGDDDVGRFYEATLQRSHQYRKAIDKLIGQRVIGTSSDSAPQYVIREKTGKSTWLKQWPLFAGALTDVPCEPRMMGDVDFKNLGLNWEQLISNAEAARQALRGGEADLESAMRLHDVLKLSI